MSDFRKTFENMLSETEIGGSKPLRFSEEEIEEQLTWIYYVMNQVKMETGTQVSIEDIVIVIREFGKRVEELKERINE